MALDSGHTQRRVPIGWSVTTRNYHGVSIGRNPRSLIYNFAKRSHIMMVSPMLSNESFAGRFIEAAGESAVW